MSNETIGERIRRARKEQGLVIDELARRTHSNHTTITHLENGTKGTNMFTFIEVARVLGVSLDYLAFGNE
jgi:transcriptional regulator with XRE-family HTH domain